MLDRLLQLRGYFLKISKYFDFVERIIKKVKDTAEGRPEEDFWNNFMYYEKGQDHKNATAYYLSGWLIDMIMGCTKVKFITHFM